MRNGAMFLSLINLLSANPTKWSNTLKQFIRSLPTNYLSVFDHFMGLALKGLNNFKRCKNSLENLFVDFG